MSPPRIGYSPAMANIEIEPRDAVTTVWLNRADKRNAMNGAVVDEMRPTT